MSVLERVCQFVRPVYVYLNLLYICAEYNVYVGSRRFMSVSEGVCRF